MEALPDKGLVGLTRGLVQIGVTVSGAFAERTGLHATDRRALQVLDELAAAGTGDPLRPGRLAERLGLSPAATTALVDRLAEAGFVERLRDLPDRRQVRLQLTPRAHRLGQEVLAPLARRIDRAAAALSPEHAQIVVAYLREVLDSGEDPSEPDHANR